MVDITPDYRAQKKRLLEEQLYSRERTKLQKRLIERAELIDEIYVCLDKSLEFFVEDGLFEATQLFWDYNKEISDWYKAYRKVVGDKNELKGTYNSMKSKLNAMKNRVNKEISDRDKYYVESAEDS